MPARFQRLRHAEAWASQGDSGLGLDAQRKLVNDYLNGGNGGSRDIPKRA
jgi:hypothetical protein